MREFRLLLHWHPQGSYLARSIFHAFKFAKKAERIHVGIVVGSNFMAQTNQDSISYIRELTKRNRNDKIVSFELITIDYALWNFSLYSSKKDRSSRTRYKGRYKELFDNSVRDSLGRGLEVCFNNKEYMTSNEISERLERERREYATELVENYRQIISAFHPDITAISHGTYDHYVAVYIAAGEESVPVLVVNGGCNMAYICETQNKVITDPCIANAFSDIVRLYREREDVIKTVLPSTLKKLITKASNRYLPNSSSGIIARSKIFNKGSHTSKPLAMLPVFAELNHHNCLEELEFKSRYEWLEWCFQMSHKSKKQLILYAHPQTNAYGQNSLTNQLVNNAANKYPTEYKLLTRLNDLEAEGLKDALVPITMASSVSLELNMLGKISCVSNYSTSSPLDCNVKFTNNDRFNDLENRFMIQKDIELSQNISEAANQALKFNSYNKFGSQDYHIRKAFEKLIWFGKYSDGSVDKFINLLEVYIEKMEVIELPTERFVQLIPY